jgi:hypothetical protein
MGFAERTQIKDPDIIDFDAVKAVAEYRKVIGHLVSTVTPEENEVFNRIALRMRTNWKAWQGEDSLHEMAFGEPDE